MRITKIGGNMACFAGKPGEARRILPDTPVLEDAHSAPLVKVSPFIAMLLGFHGDVVHI
jgi:hypothetical protein